MCRSGNRRGNSRGWWCPRWPLVAAREGLLASYSRSPRGTTAPRQQGNTLEQTGNSRLLTNYEGAYILDTTGVLPPSFPMSRHRWAVVLAGGDGFVCEVTRRIGGDSRPEQFCRIVGGKSLRSQTRARLDPPFPSGRQAFVVSRAHERFYREEPVARGRFMRHPLRGTAVAIVVAPFMS